MSGKYEWGLSLTGNAGYGTVNGADTGDNQLRDWPHALKANAKGALEYASGGWSVRVDTDFYVGGDNQPNEQSFQQTPIRGRSSRLDAFFSRSALSEEGNYGFQELSFSGKKVGLFTDGDELALKLAVFSPIEGLAYTYIHNAGGLEHASFDTAAFPDPYNPKIGPLAAAVYSIPFLQNNALGFLAQTGTAGTDAFDFSKRFHTLQLTYSRGTLAKDDDNDEKVDQLKEARWKMGDRNVALKTAVYYTYMDPKTPVSDLNEEVSALDGAGVSIIFQAEELFDANFACSFNDQNFTRPGSEKEVNYHGCNASARVFLGPAEVTGGYSWVNLNSEQKAWTEQTDSADEHLISAVVSFPLHVGPFDLTPFIGAQVVVVDQDKIFSKSDGDRPVLFIGLNVFTGGKG